MSRSKKQIRSEIENTWMNNAILATLYGFTPGVAFGAFFSIVSLESLLIEIVAAAIYVHEQVLDVHKKEVDDIVSSKQPHTPRWYRSKALTFLYGFSLYPDSDVFDVTGATKEQVLSAQIIKYAAVPKNTVGGIVQIKVATDVNGEPSPINDEQYAALVDYFSEVADAGVAFQIVNKPADLLLLSMVIYRDPLVLDSQGMNILDGNHPVREAIVDFFKNLPFDGELVLASLVDRLQSVQGVRIPHVLNAQTKVFDSVSEDYGDPQVLNVKTLPVSGYFKMENFEGISYVV